jgi:hypothetical protein
MKLPSSVLVVVVACALGFARPAAAMEPTLTYLHNDRCTAYFTLQNATSDEMLIVPTCMLDARDDTRLDGRSSSFPPWQTDTERDGSFILLPAGGSVTLSCSAPLLRSPAWRATAILVRRSQRDQIAFTPNTRIIRPCSTPKRRKSPPLFAVKASKPDDASDDWPAYCLAFR